MIQRSRVRIPSGAQEKLLSFSELRVEKVVLTRCRYAQPPYVYARIRNTMYARSRSCNPCQSGVDYGNTKITSMHLYLRRRNVAAQMAEEYKTVTYATPPMEERRRKNKYFKSRADVAALSAIDRLILH